MTDTKSKAVRYRSTPSLPPRPIELSLVAQFHADYVGSPEAEIDALKEGRWYPTRQDFKAVANTPNLSRFGRLTEVREVDTVGRFLDWIQFSDGKGVPRPRGSIGRLNIFAHGQWGQGSQAPCFGLAGKVDRTRPKHPVRFDDEDGMVPPLVSSSLDGWKARRDGVLKRNTIDEQVLAALTETPTDDDGGRIVDPKEGQLQPLVSEAVMSALTPTAQIWLILCDLGAVGSGSNFCLTFAKTFRRTTRGYSEAIMYAPNYLFGSGGKSLGIRCYSAKELEKLVEADIERAEMLRTLPGCFEGRNRTSVGANGLLGRGYFCMEQGVPEELRGAHLNHAHTFHPDGTQVRFAEPKKPAPAAKESEAIFTPSGKGLDL